MGIFSNNSGKKLKNIEKNNITNIKGENMNSVCFISKETIIKGDIETESMFQLEGELEGNIKGELLIHIGSTGKVKGNIIGKSVLIDGEIIGEIIADKVEIGEKGKVIADITSDIFIIQEGGIFEGTKKINKKLTNEINEDFQKDEEDNNIEI